MSLLSVRGMLWVVMSERKETTTVAVNKKITGLWAEICVRSSSHQNRSKKMVISPMR